jgi:hypothetical protein
MGRNPESTEEKQEAQVSGMRGVPKHLREFAREAAEALAHLEAERLDELASSCADLISRLEAAEADQRVALASQAREAVSDMAVFARVLDATRANLNVMKRLRELSGERLEYSEGQLRGWIEAEAGHGDH